METSSVAEESEAQHLDILHPEPSLRENFEFPVNPKTGEQSVYVCSHGLGLMPKETRQRIQEELDCWSKSAIHAHTPEGHHYKRPWQELAESCCKLIAPLLGAQEDEVVITGALTINLHQLFVSFYRPTHLKNKILIESNSFPSDYYALSSLVSARGYNATDTLVELPCDKDYVVDMDVVVQKIYALKDELTLVWLPGVQFYTGQVFDVGKITKAAHEAGLLVGFDLSHAVGNIELNLHDQGVDFAVWCGYKYLCGGAGCTGGMYVHQRHAYDNTIPKLLGWWGKDINSRFAMNHEFKPAPGALSFAVSCTNVLSTAVIHTALLQFAKTDIRTLQAKAVLLVTKFRALLADLAALNLLRIITPDTPGHFGCHVSVKIGGGKDAHTVYENLSKRNIVADYRNPGVIRLSFSPLYNNFSDVFASAAALRESIQETAVKESQDSTGVSLQEKEINPRQKSE